MDTSQFDSGLRHRLILAGLKELEDHGVKDFSLRRVAINAEVSCAAPYRHFKDKEQLIAGIIDYVKDGWQLLAKQIEQVFNQNNRQLIIELCLSFVKFWIANGYFRSVLSLNEGNNDKNHNLLMKDFDTPIENAVNQYLTKKNNTSSDDTSLSFNVLSATYGTLMLINKQAYTSEQALKLLKQQLNKLI